MKMGKNKKQKGKRGSLTSIRESLRALMRRANRRVNLLKKKGFGESRAILRAQETKSTDSQSEELFNIDELHRYRELQREAARIREFLNDETSTPKGAKSYYDDLRVAEEYGKNYTGFSAFSGHYVDEEGVDRNFWTERYGVSYDKSRVDENSAKIAFSIYRRLEERNPNEIYGITGYGSENLIMSIYDMVVETGTNGEDEATGDIISDLSSRLDEFKKERSASAQNDILSGDYGILDNFATSRTAAEFIKNL